MSVLEAIHLGSWLILLAHVQFNMKKQLKENDRND